MTAPAHDLTAALDAVIDRALAEQRIVGALVLMARGGQPAYSRAAGLADRESGRRMEMATYVIVGLTIVQLFYIAFQFSTRH